MVKATARSVDAVRRCVQDLLLCIDNKPTADAFPRNGRG